MTELIWIMTKGGACGGRADVLPNEHFVEAPPGGGFGMRWTGSAWMPDDTADAEVEAAYGITPPPPDSCTALQGRRALGMERVNQIGALVAHLDLLMPHLSPEEIWEVQTAWEFATSWDRLGREVNMLRDLYGMTEAQRDDFMRLAVTL